MNSSTENSNNIAETLKTHCPKINLKLCRKTVFTTNAVEVTVQYMSGTKTEHTVYVRLHAVHALNLGQAQFLNRIKLFFGTMYI